MSAPRVHCWRCTMSFAIGEPSERVNTSICAEPKCRVPFWSAQISGESLSHSVRCGVWPEFAGRFETEPRIIYARPVG